MQAAGGIRCEVLRPPLLLAIQYYRYEETETTSNNGDNGLSTSQTPLGQSLFNGCNTICRVIPVRV